LSWYIYYLCVALLVIKICVIMVKKRPPKQAKHLAAAHGAEQDLETDEAQASVDT